jgi:hypothetical protein
VGWRTPKRESLGRLLHRSDRALTLGGVIGIDAELFGFCTALIER